MPDSLDVCLKAKQRTRSNQQTGGLMRKLIVSEFVTMDGVIQAPGGKDEDRDGGFEHGGWTQPYWHDDIGRSFGALMQDVDALLLGRRTYVTHAEAFEPMPPGDPFGDMMNAAWDGRQQPARACITGRRPGRRTAPARVSADIGKRQTP